MDGSTPAPATLYSDLTRDELEAQITELAGQLNAANYRWLTLIAEFDRRQGWADGSLHSCAHWLNFKVGLNLGAAREKVRVAHALAGVPKIAAAMARGELSYSKVRALTRVATAATEDSLLMIALHGTAYHVENTVRYFGRALQAGELSREAQQQASRTVNYWYDNDGSLVLKARLPALAGAMLVKALEAAMPAVAATTVNVVRAEERRLTYHTRRADALAQVAESYLQQESTSMSTADRYQVVVHVDAETLKDQTDGRCHIDHGPPLPAETVRRLTCDASVVRIIETEQGEPLDVGRKTRTIPPAIRRALNSRDPGCCFPGCTHRRYLDAHHIEHWADGGQTKLANLVSLCRTHHRLVHEGGIAIEVRAGGGWRFRRPDGREFEILYREPAPIHEWTALKQTHAANGLHINRDTAATRWRGERMDYELGVWTLCTQEQRARRSSQPTDTDNDNDCHTVSDNDTAGVSDSVSDWRDVSAETP
ncbi:MAG TPA: DUF222 domain-containing protein [Steroidobacteraceae bacterium]|nr:DUF222 domain-containing protein [Steroidobacteraceae bacterium]